MVGKVLIDNIYIVIFILMWSKKCFKKSFLGGKGPVL